MHNHQKTATPDVDENPYRLPERNVFVLSVPPLMGGEVSLTGGVGGNAQQSPTPTLITEQEVAFSTSAAVPLPRTKTTHWLADSTRVVAASLRPIFLTLGARPAHKYYPLRLSFLEQPRMAREMYRL